MTEPAESVNPGMIIPFGILLGCTALGPVLCSQLWLRHQLKIVGLLSLMTLGYYWIGLHAFGRTRHGLEEYAGFITLIGSLYVVAGGMHLKVKSSGSPAANTLFLLGGAVLANFLGTTGASMVLIRPWLRLNGQRLKARQIVFFIFLVSNVGGCLTPIGDPPLYIGFLQGIPFWWVAAKCWPIWIAGVGSLLGIFYGLERMDAGKEKTGHSGGNEWEFRGGINLFFLGLILASVFVTRPFFLREVLFVAAAAGSYFCTNKAVHQANAFEWHPLREIALIFFGLFITMMPALDWLQNQAGSFGNLSSGMLYWGCGLVSSGLDNAPAYLGFFKAYASHFVSPEIIAGVRQLLADPGATINGPGAGEIRQTVFNLQKMFPARLIPGNVSREQIEAACLLGNARLAVGVMAISIGSVFFGAFTYIANGPNLLVQAIARQQKAPVPSFIVYIFRYSLPCLLPMLVIIWFCFFRS